MKRFTLTLIILAMLAAPAFAGVQYQKWQSDAPLPVTLSTTPSTTDLDGTEEIWESVPIHNRSTTIWVGITLITPTEDGSGMTNFATADYLIPPLMTLTFTNEKALEVKAVAESGTPQIIIERHHKVN